MFFWVIHMKEGFIWRDKAAIYVHRKGSILAFKPDANLGEKALYFQQPVI